MINNSFLNKLDASFSFPSPSSSRPSSVADEEYEDPIRGPQVTHPAIIIPKKTASMGQISLTRQRRRMENRYAPYLNSLLGGRGRIINNEMAEDLSSRYTKEIKEKFLGDPVSKQDRKDLRKRNTGVRFIDGLHRHSYDKKQKPGRNDEYDTYKFLRSKTKPSPYEDSEWEKLEELKLKHKNFSNQRFSPKELLQEIKEKFLGDPVSKQDRKDLRKRNTGVRFIDGLHRHSYDKKQKPGRNDEYDTYKFLRSKTKPSPYEDSEWEKLEELKLKHKNFSNQRFSPKELLQVRRDELNKLQEKRGIIILPPTFLMDDYFDSIDDHPSIMDDY
ncbi:hypothetical protein Glove_26g117 [Diversispora epigaea]|uniref:Uncharacterized protein n=1 Tax=Diversispora epigaea TaxID=1348612 RepID=A0A397JQ28_9GLOM|nr:hypothetical protein Glove_26g117 [Diversispora epigaea]